MIINMQSGGVVPERIIDAQTITPGTENQVISAGTYLKGALTILGDPDLIPENIKENKNIFGKTGTFGAGAYAWRKSEIIQPKIEYINPSIRINANENNATLYITAINFDLTKISNWKSFFADFKASGGYPYIDSYGNNIVFNSGYSVPLSSFTANSATSGIFVMSSAYLGDTKTLNLAYAGTKVIQSLVINPIGFIVSNNADDYPNGGDHTDGYYYELIGQVSSANVMNLSDTALMTVQQDYRDTLETEVSNANS